MMQRFMLAVVSVTLSVMNDGIVSEANGAMQVLVSRYSGTDLQTDITVSIQTEDGTGKFINSNLCSYSR